MREYDLVIIGGGAAGILCALNGKENGINNILIIEKEASIGGALILGDYNISSKKNITGKEYLDKLKKEIDLFNINIDLNTMVLKIEDNNSILCTSSNRGIEKIKAQNIIIANGGKETSKSSLAVVGDRLSGVYTAGMAKKILNMNDIRIGKNILIIGNDTLYIVEKSLKEKNINVIGIVSETYKPQSITSNVYLGYKLEAVEGNGRLEKVLLTKGNEDKVIECDTLIFANKMLSDGVVAMRSNIKLNPLTTGAMVNENFETSREGIYACGNGIYIHESIEDIEKECKNIIENIVK